jgi:hypothetical protein
MRHKLPSAEYYEDAIFSYSVAALSAFDAVQGHAVMEARGIITFATERL